MTNWETYVKESYSLIKEAEQALSITLEHNVEAYLVHLFAHFMDKPNINTEPVCIKLMASANLPIAQRKVLLKDVGDECLLINAMEWNKRRWPSNSYYAEMGQMAYMNRAFAVRPVEDIYDDLSMEFTTVTQVLRKCRIS
jgi:hypothetical protein